MTQLPHPLPCLPLDNPDWEAFAQARARGLSSLEAAKEAGYARPTEEASRLRKRPPILARIGVILERRGGGGSNHVGGVIDRLIELSDEARGDGADARRLGVACSALEAAGRLKPLVPDDLIRPTPPQPAMTIDEWRAEFDPNWRERQGGMGAG